MSELLDGWVETTLGENCIKIGSGATPRGGNEVYKSMGISLIRSQNILDFDFSYSGLAFIDASQAAKLKNVEVLEHDVLINITGDSVARVCKVPKGVLPARVNQHVSILRVDDKKLSSSYLQYYLLNPIYKRHLLTLANSGGTRNALTKTMLELLELSIPPLPEQKAIAAVLSAFDHKIELLREQNRTLEILAQTIFKEWFVQFNFPDKDGKPYRDNGGEMVDSELGKIPKGWNVGNIGDVLELLYGKPLKTEDRTGAGFPVYGSNGIVGYHKDYIVKGPGVIVGRKGSMGEVVWCDDNFYPIDTTFYVSDLLGVSAIYFHYFLLKRYNFEKIGSDSAVPGLNRNAVYLIDVIVPLLDVVENFNTLCKSVFEKIKNNTAQIQTLAKTRDTLLPKLMSGKTRVKGFEQ